MTIPFYEVVAFTNERFAGNPAGVCLLEKSWLPDEVLQQIAAENNLPETAFVLPRADYFDLRWMTPTVEVDLCGHATLAAAHVLMRHRACPNECVIFHTKSGELQVNRAGEKLVLDFPALPAEPVPMSDELAAALGATPVCLLKGRDYLAVYETEADVAALRPDFARVAQLDAQGVIATSPGVNCDFVSRYFAPAAGIPEDPVTGSTHCALVPYWSARLGKKELHARQISQRGGDLFCRERGARVEIGGHAVTYVEGLLHYA